MSSTAPRGNSFDYTTNRHEIQCNCILLTDNGPSSVSSDIANIDPYSVNRGLGMNSKFWGSNRNNLTGREMHLSHFFFI